MADSEQVLAVLRAEQEPLTVAELAVAVADPDRVLLTSVRDAVAALEQQGMVRRVTGSPRMAIDLVAS